MIATNEIIKVIDDRGFHYDVKIEHKPNLGFTTAYYYGSIIGQVELGRILQPVGDDDREWEMFEERFCEWKDEIKVNIIPVCKEYFNKQSKK